MKSWKHIAAACGLGAIILAVSIFIVRSYTDHLLRSDATSRAESWAVNLAENVSDLPRIIAGALPGDESVVFFEQARAIGDVWKYRIYDSAGKLVLVSNQIGRTHSFDEKLASSDPAALARLQAGEIQVTTRSGASPREPGFIADAIVPITAAGQRIGFLSVQIDQTARQQVYFVAAIQMAVALCGLVLLAFGLPAAGFLLRSRQKEAVEGRLEYLAYHDSLTGLKNRHAMTQRLEALFAGPDAPAEFAIHIVDLDKFKEINDTLGHDMGDEVLRQVSSRLASAVAGEGEAGRIGGDEFLIIQTGPGAAAKAEVLANRLAETLALPNNYHGSRVRSAVSIGSSVFPGDGRTASDLMKSADIALYFAKAEGRGCYRMFRPGMDEKLKRRRAIEQRLHTALAEDGFQLHFQPLFNLASGNIEGVEALLRLPDAVMGMVPPSEFIPIAEDIGLIDQVGAWVIAEGCRSLKHLPPPMKLAINLSPIQFEKGDIVEIVAQALRESNVDPARLELEVTESLLLKDSAAVQSKIVRLKSLGVSIVLDDFGAGYSSLSYLWRYPFDKIKIDRSFISSLGDSVSVEGVIESIIHLGRKLNMRVTAEGIETNEQADMLRALHCDQVQGYLFSRPLTMADLSATMLRGFLHQQSQVVELATARKKA